MKFVTPFVAVLGSAIAFRQWSRVRHENTIEKYFDRVAAINMIVDAYHKAQAQSDDQKHRHYTNMIAFTELLTLEYVLLKFELGYCDLTILERALKSFDNRSSDAVFAKAAQHWIGNSDLTVKTSYRESTKRAAHAILAKHPSAASPNEAVSPSKQ